MGNLKQSQTNIWFNLLMWGLSLAGLVYIALILYTYSPYIAPIGYDEWTRWKDTLFLRVFPLTFLVFMGGMLISWKKLGSLTKVFTIGVMSCLLVLGGLTMLVQAVIGHAMPTHQEIRVKITRTVPIQKLQSWAIQFLQHQKDSDGQLDPTQMQNVPQFVKNLNLSLISYQGAGTTEGTVDLMWGGGLASWSVTLGSPKRHLEKSNEYFERRPWIKGVTTCVEFGGSK